MIINKIEGVVAKQPELVGDGLVFHFSRGWIAGTRPNERPFNPESDPLKSEIGENKLSLQSRI